MEETADALTDTTPTNTSEEHQEKMALAKQFLGEQARIVEDMKRQQAALFAQLGLSATDIGGDGPTDEALMEPPPQEEEEEKRRRTRSWPQ